MPPKETITSRHGNVPEARWKLAGGEGSDTDRNHRSTFPTMTAPAGVADRDGSATDDPGPAAGRLK